MNDKKEKRSIQKQLVCIMLSLILGVLCIGCEREKELLPEQAISSYARELFLQKNPYIGDPSANGKILELLGIGEELGEYTIELQTQEEPYWIRLNFETCGADREVFDVKMLDKAYMLLALIDNAHEVQFSYPYKEGNQETFITFYVSQKQATDAMGKSIKSFADSESGIQILLKQLESK